MTGPATHPDPKIRRCAIVLAGGQSTRMGRSKADLPWGGTTLLEHTIATLRESVDEIILVVDDPRRFERISGVTIVADRTPREPPLGQLENGLSFASGDLAFVCGCDQPFLDPRTIDHLFDLAGGFDMAIPEVDGRLEPLHAVYARSILPIMHRLISDGITALRDLPGGCNARVVADRELQSVDPELRSLMNVNTPEEYSRAVAASNRFSGADPPHSSKLDRD